MSIQIVDFKVRAQCSIHPPSKSKISLVLPNKIKWYSVSTSITINRSFTEYMVEIVRKSCSAEIPRKIFFFIHFAVTLVPRVALCYMISSLNFAKKVFVQRITVQCLLVSTFQAMNKEGISQIRWIWVFLLFISSDHLVIDWDLQSFRFWSTFHVDNEAILASEISCIFKR